MSEPIRPRVAAASVAATTYLAATHTTATPGAGPPGAARGSSGHMVTSADAGWTSVLLAVCEGGDDDGAVFESAPTPDQTLVLSLNGPSELECFSGGRWRRAVRPAGSAGLTPGGATDRLRRRARDRMPIRTAHLFIPQAFFDDAGEHYRRTGVPVPTEPLNALAFRDPGIIHPVVSLIRAMDSGAPDLYAQTAAQFLAAHLLWRNQTGAGRWSDRRQPEVLTDRRLARVVEYASAHLREPLTLEGLAAEAGISKFHFARLFKAATGEAPHRFLVRLRLDAARQMLCDTDMTAAEVAAASGYASPAKFGAAFRRETGCTPAAFRRTARVTACPRARRPS